MKSVLDKRRLSDARQAKDWHYRVSVILPEYLSQQLGHFLLSKLELLNLGWDALYFVMI